MHDERYVTDVASPCYLRFHLQWSTCNLRLKSKHSVFYCRPRVKHDAFSSKKNNNHFIFILLNLATQARAFVAVENVSLFIYLFSRHQRQFLMTRSNKLGALEAYSAVSGSVNNFYDAGLLKTRGARVSEKKNTLHSGRFGATAPHVITHRTSWRTLFVIYVVGDASVSGNNDALRHNWLAVASC